MLNISETTGLDLLKTRLESSSYVEPLNSSRESPKTIRFVEIARLGAKQTCCIRIAYPDKLEASTLNGTKERQEEFAAVRTWGELGSFAPTQGLAS